jgi:hypothetical protein
VAFVRYKYFENPEARKVLENRYKPAVEIQD